MAILKLAPNLPLRLAVKYIDAAPPSDAKYSPQARIKTDTNDILYLPGHATDSFAELQRAGVIVGPPASLPMTPGEKMVAVQVKAGGTDVIVTLEQAAGEKHGKVKVALANGGTGNGATPPQAVPAAYTPPQQETGAPPIVAVTTAPAGSETPLLATYDNPLYLSLVQFVRDDVIPMLDGEASPESFAAMVNTLFIFESKR